MDLRREDADGGDRAVASDHGLNRNDPFAPGGAHRRGIDRAHVLELARGADVAADPDAGRALGLGRLRRGSEAALPDGDRLAQVADLQRDRAIPVARVLQVELLAQRLEARDRRREDVLPRLHAGELEASRRVGGRGPPGLTGVLECDLDAWHYRS